MPVTPDEPATGLGRPADPEAALSAAEAAHLAARETVSLDARGGRPTVRLDVGGEGLANRETVRLPSQRQRVGGRSGRPAPLPLAAAVAAAWAAAVSYAPVAMVLVLAQLAGGGGSPADAARLGLAGWLLGHGVPLDTAQGPLALTPLGLSALVAWRLVRAGVHTIRGIGARHTGSAGRAVAAAATIGVAYGLLGTLAAAVVSGAGPYASPVRAGLTLAAFGMLASLLGTVYSSGALSVAAFRTPGVVRDAVRTGLVVALMLLAIGAATAGVSIAWGGGEASDVLAAYRTGVAGQAGVTLVCLAYAPNAAVWAVAYLVGPGFALGQETVVRLTEVSVGGLPALPIFAGLPAGPMGGVGAALVGVPVAAGTVGGWLLARRRTRRAAAASRTAAGARTLPQWRGLLAAAALTGPVTGCLLGLAATASTGALGGDRLSEIGPVGWQVAAASAGFVAVGAVIGAAAARVLVGPGGDRPS